MAMEVFSGTFVPIRSCIFVDERRIVYEKSSMV